MALTVEVVDGGVNRKMIILSKEMQIFHTVTIIVIIVIIIVVVVIVVMAIVVTCISIFQNRRGRRLCPPLK